MMRSYPVPTELDLEGIEIRWTADDSYSAQVRAACAEIRRLRALANVELDAQIRRWFEIYDRPCEPNGMWRHADEFQRHDDKLRRLVGAPRRPTG